MFAMTLAAIVQVSFLGAPESGFDQALKQSMTTGRPLVVLIGADWCPSCQVMKNTTIPQVAEEGGLDSVVYTYVDADQHRRLVSRLSRVRSIPQLIRFDRTPSGWQGRLLVGAQSVDDVYAFLNSDVPVVITDQGPAPHTARNNAALPAPSDLVGDPQTHEPLAKEAY